MIAAARARAEHENADVSFQLAKAETLPFPDDQFDIVTAVTILCFIDDAAPVFPAPADNRPTSSLRRVKAWRADCWNYA